jgi:hypothetical protein
MDCPVEISTSRKKISRHLLLISVGFFYAYLVLPLDFLSLFILRMQGTVDMVNLANSIVLFTSLPSFLIHLFPVLGGILLIREMKEHHSSQWYVIPFLFVSCMAAISDILFIGVHFLSGLSSTAGVFILQATLELLLPATAWYLMVGIQKSVCEISIARIRVVAGIGIAGIVILVPCMCISAGLLFWSFSLLVFSGILFPAVGAQFLLVSKEMRNPHEEPVPKTPQRISKTPYANILLTTLLIISALLLTGGYVMINCLTENTCQKISSSLADRPVHSLIPMSIPPARYHNIFKQYWIVLMPVYNKQVGEKLLINATTNLPVGEEVRCDIKSDNEYIPLKNQKAASDIVKVTAGENGLNKIVLSVDTAALVPDMYAHGQKGSVSQFGLALTEQALWYNAKNRTFILLDAPAYDITLDPISDKQFGDKITVIGKTNIPTGSHVRVFAYPLLNMSNEIMITESSLIIPEKNGLNKTITTIDSSVFPVVEYNKYRVVEEYRSYYNSSSRIYISHTGATGFNIGAQPPAPHYLSVQACSYNYPGETQGIGSSPSQNFTIVSATNLSTGEDISWELRSIPFGDVFLFNGTPIANGTANVTKGDAGVNQTAVTIDLLKTLDSNGFIILEKGRNEEAFGYEMCFPNFPHRGRW